MLYAPALETLDVRPGRTQISCGTLLDTVASFSSPATATIRTDAGRSKPRSRAAEEPPPAATFAALRELTVGGSGAAAECMLVAAAAAARARHTLTALTFTHSKADLLPATSIGAPAEALALSSMPNDLAPASEAFWAHISRCTKLESLSHRCLLWPRVDGTYLLQRVMPHSQVIADSLVNLTSLTNLELAYPGEYFHHHEDSVMLDGSVLAEGIKRLTGLRVLHLRSTSDADSVFSIRKPEDVLSACGELSLEGLTFAVDFVDLQVIQEALPQVNHHGGLTYLGLPERLRRGESAASSGALAALYPSIEFAFV